jgi:hypothetical protein
VARATGFLPASEDGLVVRLGEQLGDILLTLEPGRHITGTVDVEGTPQSEAKIVAKGEGFVRLASTDELGHFEIDGLPNGTFSVRAYHEGLGGDEKTVESGGSVQLSLGYRQKIRGRVLDERGFPAEAATIFTDYAPTLDSETDPYPQPRTEGDYGLGLHGCGPLPSCYQRAVTAADGRFELDATPGETLTVGAQAGDHYALTFDVQTGADNLVLELQPARRVQIVYDEGVPPSEEPPSALLRQPAFFYRELVSDPKGWISLPPFADDVALPPGTHLAGDLPRGVSVRKPKVRGMQIIID